MTDKRTDRPADYISVPVNFADDIKVKPFIRKFGSEGYAFCLKMLCFLASQTGFEYSASKDDLEDLCDYMDMDEAQFKKMWKFATDKGLFHIVIISGASYFRSEYLEDRLLDQLLKKRNRNANSMRNSRGSKKPVKKKKKKEELDPQGNPIVD
jgi:hypothetical protein